ncbi:hypothetical protein ACRRTK_005087 [Alexandromys fortis]
MCSIWEALSAGRLRAPGNSCSGLPKIYGSFIFGGEAFDIMKVTHGREHSLIEDLILLMEECDANIRAS